MDWIFPTRVKENELSFQLTLIFPRHKRDLATASTYMHFSRKGFGREVVWPKTCK